MTIEYNDVLTALKMDNGFQMRRSIEVMSIHEQVEVGTFIGPGRLQAVALNPQWSAEPDGENSKITTANLAETSKQAFDNSLTNLPDDVRAMLTPWRTLQVKKALLRLTQQRTAAPLLKMDSDITSFLPTPNGMPGSLTEADYFASGKRNDLEVAAIKAVANVESGGRTGFDDSGRPKILFEAHHFGPLTNNRFDRTHPHLSCKKWSDAKRFYSWDQYRRLHEAMIVDAALSAASWGKFQVLGRYHNGWPEVRSYVRAAYESEQNHLIAFEEHCKSKNLMPYARKKDWLRFANGYNGDQQKGYDIKMAAEYKKLGGR